MKPDTPTDARTAGEQALTAFRSGRFDEAADLFARVGRSPDDDGRAVFYQGVAASRQGRWPEADRLLTEAEKRLPRDAAVKNELCAMLRASGRPGADVHCRFDEPLPGPERQEDRPGNEEILAALQVMLGAMNRDEAVRERPGRFSAPFAVPDSLEPFFMVSRFEPLDNGLRRWTRTGRGRWLERSATGEVRTYDVARRAVVNQDTGTVFRSTTDAYEVFVPDAAAQRRIAVRYRTGSTEAWRFLGIVVLRGAAPPGAMAPLPVGQPLAIQRTPRVSASTRSPWLSSRFRG